MHEALGGKADEEETFEEDATQDAVNAEIEKRISSRKMLAERQLLRLHRHAQEQDAGVVRREARGRRQGAVPLAGGADLHHQAGDPGEIHPRRGGQLHPGHSFYHVAKTVEDDPDFDKVKALKKIRHYVESHDKAIRRKAEIMVDHFIAQVAGKQKIGGKARAMIVCNGIARAIDYWREVSDYLDRSRVPTRPSWRTRATSRSAA
jgi:type I restriction enzyme R subunit